MQTSLDPRQVRQLPWGSGQLGQTFWIPAMYWYLHSRRDSTLFSLPNIASWLFEIPTEFGEIMSWHLPDFPGTQWNLLTTYQPLRLIISLPVSLHFSIQCGVCRDAGPAHVLLGLLGGDPEAMAAHQETLGHRRGTALPVWAHASSSLSPGQELLSEAGPCSCSPHHGVLPRGNRLQHFHLLGGWRYGPQSPRT